MVNKYSNKINGKNNFSSKYLVNELIKAKLVLVIDESGQNIGTVKTSEAIQKAADVNLDLVQVGVKNDVPVTKIMDFGKFLYIKKKQINDSKKTQKKTQLKEIKLRPNIGEQDYKTKLKQAKEFFEDGKKIKFTLQFKGRNIRKIDTLAPEIFEKITSDLQEQKVGTLVEEKQQRGGSFWSKTYFVKK